MNNAKPKGTEAIMTVKGEISPEQLGFCHAHEHLFIANGPSAKVNPVLRLDSFPKTLAELRLYQSVGGQAIVDAQPVGCGRMAQLLFQVATESRIHVVAATGFHKLCYYPSGHWIYSISTEKLAEIFITEYREGMYVDGDYILPRERATTKPGVIKVAVDAAGLTPPYRRLLSAAAIAAQETGLPVLSHVERGAGALELITFFLDHGLSPERLILCHLDRDLRDFAYHRQVAETGVYLEYDTIGRCKYHSDEEEAAHIRKMVAAGFQGQILLGLDVTRSRMKNYGGRLGLDYISTEFIPLLKRVGLDETVINDFMIKNPAKAFQTKKGRA